MSAHEANHNDLPGDLLIVDALQYVNWNRDLLQAARRGGLSAIHVTVAYWESFEETRTALGEWNALIEENADLVCHVRAPGDIAAAHESGLTGIIFGAQNCSPIDDALANVERMHALGLRIMQLSYNNQSLLATGCYEQRDSGVTRFGREVVREMNRLGMLIDMSHSAELSTLEAIECSGRPIAITHANPSVFHAAKRNKSDAVLQALADSGGMLGLSLYPFHLPGGSDCTLAEFCRMALGLTETLGPTQVGIGSDLCLGWGYETLEWMRSGRWAATPDFGEGSADAADWPAQPDWFADHSGFRNIASGLAQAGADEDTVRRLMGLNWLSFLDDAFKPGPP